MSADSGATRPPVIAFSNIVWGGIYNTVEPRLTGLAGRGWPVVHSNGALSLWDRYGSRWAQAALRGRFEMRDGVLLDHTGRWPPRWQTWEAWDGFAVGLHARRLKRAAGRGGTDAMIAYLFDPLFYSYLRALDPAYVVFQVIDNYSYQPGWTPDANRMLEALVERADRILANNPSQARLLPGNGPAKARILTNAVDLPRIEAGRSAPCPADLSRIPAPRIGYVGMINAKIDFPMIAEVAEARPEWNWVLIGPQRKPEGAEFAEVAAAWHRCERLANVHFLGYRDRGDIAAYLSWMQVNALCYRLSAGHWTRSAYPFKVLECLATGVPVVSAAMPEVMRHHDIMDFADTPAEWIAALERAFSRGGVGTVEERLAVARANSWDTRVDELDRVLHEMVDSPPD